MIYQGPLNRGWTTCLKDSESNGTLLLFSWPCYSRVNLQNIGNFWQNSRIPTLVVRKKRFILRLWLYAKADTLHIKHGDKSTVSRWTYKWIVSNDQLGLFKINKWRTLELYRQHVCSGPYLNNQKSASISWLRFAFLNQC